METFREIACHTFILMTHFLPFDTNLPHMLAFSDLFKNWQFSIYVTLASYSTFSKNIGNTHIVKIKVGWGGVVQIN
jgi:hypothetical protein